MDYGNDEEGMMVANQALECKGIGLNEHVEDARWVANTNRGQNGKANIERCMT